VAAAAVGSSCSLPPGRTGGCSAGSRERKAISLLPPYPSSSNEPSNHGRTTRRRARADVDDDEDVLESIDVACAPRGPDAAGQGGNARSPRARTTRRPVVLDMMLRSGRVPVLEKIKATRTAAGHHGDGQRGQAPPAYAESLGWTIPAQARPLERLWTSRSSSSRRTTPVRHRLPDRRARRQAARAAGPPAVKRAGKREPEDRARRRQIYS